jgi:translocation and assembly module TamB
MGVRTSAGRAAALVGGVLLGVLFLGLVAWFYSQAARERALRDDLLQALDLPADAFRLESISGGAVRVSARNLLLLDERGDTVLAAPFARLTLAEDALAGDGPIVLSDVELRAPYLRLVEVPEGEWNVQRVVRATIDDQPIETEEGRPIVLAGVRIIGGRALVATPWDPAAEPAFGSEDVALTRLYGRSYRVRTARDVDATLSRVRVGGGQGWRAEIASASAVLTDPALRLTALRGVVEEMPDGIAFDVPTIRTDRSVLAAAGRIRTARDPIGIELRASAAPLDFADLRWFSAMVPPEGRASGVFDVASTAGGRISAVARDLEVVTLDSRITGRLTVALGAGEAAVFRDTDLTLEPLDLRLIRGLGFADLVPYDGEVRGRITTVTELEGTEGPLDLDVVATLRPLGAPDAPVSTLAAQGGLSLLTDGGVQLDRMRVGLRPLDLAALEPLLPEQAELLRGTVRGSVLVGGTLAALRLSEGDLTYSVGNAQDTRIAGLAGTIVLEPELAYELVGSAQPLALGTIAEFVPAFPFQRAPLAGPIRVEGDAEEVRFDVNLRGDVGGFAAGGRFRFGEPGTLSIAGRLDGLQPARLMRADVPFAGPISGPFQLEGTTNDLRFDVDLTQAEGRFALAGRVVLPDGLPPIVEAEGEVEGFRLGTLIGRTGLFAAPLTGDVRVGGGGGAAYAFDLDLSGPGAALQTEGWYLPAAIPVYAASGRVGGLDLRLVPGLEQAPPTSLAAAFSVSGEGTTLEALAGRFDVDATGSLIGGLPLQAGRVRVDVRDGIASFDTLRMALAGARLEAAGEWGLTRPSASPLSFTLDAADLTALTPLLRSMQLIEPQLTGSLSVSGDIAGTIEFPTVNVEGSGRNLRFDGWRAGTLAFGIDAMRTTVGWTGGARAAGRSIVLAGAEQFDMIQIGAAGTPEIVELSLAARRDRSTELTLTGAVELEDGTPQGLALEAMTLRIAESQWELERPTAIRWGEVEGLAVADLQLVRSGPATGRIAVSGRVPPTGILDLRVQAENVDVGEFSRLLPGTPPIGGVLTMDAVLEGPSENPAIALDARVDGFRYFDASAESIVLGVRFADESLVADAAIWDGGVQVATGDATVPLRIRIEDLVPVVEAIDERTVAARVRADSLPLALVAAAAPFVSRGAGTLSGEFNVGGLLGSPQLQGSALVRDGALDVDELNIRLVEIRGNLALEGNAVIIESLTARSGGGAALTGRIVLDDRSAPMLDLSASFNQFRGMNREDVASILASGSVALAGRFPTPTLTGRVELSNGTITLPSFEDEAIFEIGTLDLIDVIGAPLPTEALEPTFVETIRIQGLVVVIGDGVWAASPEMRVNIGGELLVSRYGPEEWQVFGDVLARRGSYTLNVGPLVRDFDVISGRIDFFGTPDLNPALDIVAQHRIRSTGPAGSGVLNILVNITGTAQFPRVSLTSDTQPPLPESEILSYLIFGRPTFAIGEVGGGLAQQLLLQEFAGGILASQVEQLIRQAGLPFDYIRIRGRPTASEFAADPLGTTTLEVGWQLLPDVFWTVEWGVGGLLGREFGDTWATSLEWQIDRQWSTRVAWEPLRQDRLLQQRLIGLSELNRQFSLQLRRRWEYGITPDPEVDESDLVGEPAEAGGTAATPEGGSGTDGPARDGGAPPARPEPAPAAGADPRD